MNQTKEQSTEIEVLDPPIITDEEATHLYRLQKQFLQSYVKHKGSMPLQQWLQTELQTALPQHSSEQIQGYVTEILDTIEVQQEYRTSLDQALQQGKTKEQWLTKTVMEASKAMEMQKVGDYLQRIDNAMLEANTQLYHTVLTKQGAINQNPNLDGFIAEQHTVNTFNLDAALKDKNYTAMVLKPKEGQGFQKNSIDTQVVDYTQNNNLGYAGKVVQKYQAKFGKDAETTAGYFEKGDYAFQRKLVPKDQQPDIAGSAYKKEYNGVEGAGLTKAEAKQLQHEVQQGNLEAVRVDWNYYQVKHLAMGIGQKAAFAGLQSAAVSTGFEVARKVVQGERLDGEELLEIALRTGTDTGVNAALSGAIKVAAEKGLIQVIPPGTPAGVIAQVVYIGTENAKILYKVATGELTVREGMEKMQETTVVMAAGAVASSIGALEGAALGAAALSFIPGIGTAAGALIGGLVGGTVAYMAGSKIGETVYKASKKVYETARDTAKAIVKSGASVVRSAWNSVTSTVSSIGSSIKSAVSSFSSWW